MTQYIAIDYISYHKPTYIGSILCILIFATFISMMYLALSYETYNRQNKCEPQFYYGQACRNMITDKLLLNPKFVDAKTQFYKDLNNYDVATQKNKGATETIKESKELIHDLSGPAIEKAMDENKDFIRKNEEEINGMSSILQLISLKYLGNVKNIITHASDLPQSVQYQLETIPQELDNLKLLVKATLVDPMYAKYSAPLQKLYQSLREIPDAS
jgi:hypothetical protein